MIGPVDDSSLTELESRHKMRILFLLTLLFSFSCCQRLSPPWNPPLDPPEVPIRDVWAVKDGKAELPCDIAPPDPTDQIYLVLWYRELAGKPLYSYDLRGKPPNAGRHWSAEPTFGFGQRANFRVPAAENNTALVIKDVSLMDEGVYRCRVDYRNSPTRNMKLNLTVVGVIGAPQNGEEDGELTTEGINVYTSVSPPESLCDVSEDTVACSIYDFLRSIFKVGRSVGTLVSTAQRVVGSERNGKEYLLGDGIQDNVNYYEKTYLNELLPPQINNLKDLVKDIKDIAEAYIEFETKRSKDTFKTFEDKYNAIVKEYNDAEPGLYDRPVTANIWWYSWLPPRYYFNKYIEQAPAAEKKLNEIKDQVNRTLSSISKQFNGLSSK